MAIWALAGTLAFSFLLELIGASAANSSGWGIVGAIAAIGRLPDPYDRTGA